MMDNSKIRQVLVLQAGWIPVDKGTYQTDTDNGTFNFSFTSEGKPIDGPISTILARKGEKGT
jgi:hypothetical protein